MITPMGSNILSLATLFATSPPCSNDTAPIIAYSACASTSSEPDPLTFSACNRKRTNQHQLTQHKTSFRVRGKKKAYLLRLPPHHGKQAIFVRQIREVPFRSRVVLDLVVQSQRRVERGMAKRRAAELVRFGGRDADV